MNEFRTWKLGKIEYLENSPIDFGRLHLNFGVREFEIFLGSKPSVFNGLEFSLKDRVLMEEHEKSHAYNLIDGIDKRILSAIMVIGDRAKEEERLRLILKSEINAWKRTFKTLKAESNLDWLEKAQEMLNGYVFSYLRS